MEILKRFYRWLFALPQPLDIRQWQHRWSDILQENVAFYRALSEGDKQVFQQRVQLFLHTTEITAGEADVSEQDRLLVAASAIIPVWSFPKWHYFNLNTVYLLPGPFNREFACGQPDSVFTGMVGTGPMSGKMALSQPHLVQGFSNSRDMRNVGVHEFVHLIDMADGDCDGYPERLREYQYAIPWLDLVDKKTREIFANRSNIDPYGATHPAEFLAVASEYFFERPTMLEKKHPKLYQALSELYQQDVAAINLDILHHKNKPCPCGSGKKYKRCCLPRK